MCGIFGWIEEGLGADELRDGLESMARRLHHRGPDSHGFHVAPGVGLGMVRLAIIDLATGDQPLYSLDRRYAIVFNGEIYNHQELRRDPALAGYPFTTQSDTETLLAGFARLGPDILPRLNGMFAFAVWDTQEQRLFLARDRYGVKPLYLQRLGRGLRFASEVKALLGPAKPEPDMEVLAQYLQLGYVPSPLCAFGGVDKLPAGHFAWLQNGRLSVSRWFRPAYGNARPDSEAAVLAQLDRRLNDAVRRELLSDVPLGLFLSGGLDSSLVAAYAARHCPGIRSFALGFQEATHDEAADAETVARHLGLTHETLRLSQAELTTAFRDVAASLDEPFADSTVVPLLALSRFARRQVTVALTGWGGDEIFMGYPTLKAHRLARLYRLLPGWLGRDLVPALVRRLPVSDRYMSFEFRAKRFLAGMDQPSELQHLAWMGYFTSEELPALLQPAWRERLGAPRNFLADVVADLRAKEPLDRILELDSRLFLEGNGLFQADRMSMLASLEARVPLLNPELSDWANALPWTAKMPGLRLKHLLKQLAKRMLPSRIVSKPKKGFGPPTAQWVRGPLAVQVRDILSPERLHAAGMLNVREVSRLLAEHQTRTADHGRRIWALVSLQLWLERYMVD